MEGTPCPKWLFYLVTIVSVPSVVLALIGGTGLWAFIAFIVGLIRYWGEWGMFIGVIVIKTFESSGTAGLREYIQKYGQESYESLGLGLMTSLLQYLLIWFAIKSFF